MLKTYWIPLLINIYKKVTYQKCWSPLLMDFNEE